MTRYWKIAACLFAILPIAFLAGVFASVTGCDNFFERGCLGANPLAVFLGEASMYAYLLAMVTVPLSILFVIAGIIMDLKAAVLRRSHSDQKRQ